LAQARCPTEFDGAHDKSKTDRRESEMRTQSARLCKLTLATLLALGGAGACQENGGNIDDSLVSETRAALLGGANSANTQAITSESDPVFAGRFQSETSMAISTYNGTTMRIVGYNAQDIESYMYYDSNYRYVDQYASLMGWSYRSAAAGKSWNAGHVYDFILGSSNLLLGDPSVAAMPRTPNVYLVNLSGNMSAQVAVDPLDPYGDPTLGYVMSGGCIARSTDQGQTFDMWKCVPKSATPYDPNSATVYDGSSVVALSDSTATKQHIYVAFHNESAASFPIDVWLYTETAGDFSLLSNPFPNSVIVSHPRLYSSNRYDKKLKVYVVAVDKSGQLLMNSHDGTNWAWTSPVVVASGVETEPRIPLGGAIIKTAPGGYAFAVGRSEYDNSVEEARFFYSAYASNYKIGLKGARCLLSGTPKCSSPVEWVTPSSAQSFNPAVDAGYNSSNQWDWRVSYYTDNDNVSTGQLKIFHANPKATKNSKGAIVFSFNPKAATAAQTPCPSKGKLYWGDYDDMRADPAGNGIYYRTFTDSTDSACDTSQSMRGAPQHVTEVKLPKI
jgi:hypothetical protein